MTHKFPLKIYTDTTDAIETTAKALKFMVGDNELAGVTECNIHPIGPNSILLVTITVSVQLGK